VVSTQMGKQGLQMLFSDGKGVKGTEDVDEGLILDAPLLDRIVTKRAVSSLEMLESLCCGKLERTVWEILIGAARSLERSSQGGESLPILNVRLKRLIIPKAYIELRKMYALFAHTMTPSDFTDFTSSISPSAQTYKILQAHFVALQLILEPLAKNTVVHRAECPVKELGRAATVGWLTALHAEIKERNGKFLKWTREVERRALREGLPGRKVEGSQCIIEKVGKERCGDKLVMGGNVSERLGRDGCLWDGKLQESVIV